MNKPKILVFASGSAEGGGSGFENLVVASRTEKLNADIVGVVSNYASGGVKQKADRLGIPFRYFPYPWTDTEYQKIAIESEANWFALSGWLKLVAGLDLATKFNSKTVFNIHPDPLPEFGGKGMYGHHVHEAVIAAFKRGEITHSAVTMHYVISEFDRGPIFLRRNITIFEDETPEDLARRVNRVEHMVQPLVTDLIVNEIIKWDGINPESLNYPSSYEIERYV